MGQIVKVESQERRRIIGFASQWRAGFLVFRMRDTKEGLLR